jgi:multiple sugar transport system permease protein
MPGGDGRKIGTEALRYAVLAVFVVLLAFPFYWMFVATFKQNIDLYNVENNPFKFNLPPTLDHLKLLFNETRYVRWLGNTALVGVLVDFITLAFS